MLKSNKFWSYETSENFDLTPEMISSYKLKNKFLDDAFYFYDQIGTGPHPSFKSLIGKDLQNQQVMSFQNILVDMNTLKILFTLLPHSKISSLRFASNIFTVRNLEFLITSLLTKPNNIYNFTFEWNDKISVDGIEYSMKDIKTFIDEKLLADMNKSQELLVSLVTTEPYNLEALCLRGNFIGDVTAMKIFEGLKKNTYMRILNLYKNDLTNACMNVFGEMLIVNRKLEEVNLGGNHLSDDTLRILKENSGKFLLSEEEYEEYTKLAKERQDIINKNVKLKAAKKPEMDVPFIDEVVSEDGKNYKVRNGTLRVVNLIQNDFTENSFEDLIAVLDGIKELLITVDLKAYNENQREKLMDENGTYWNRIYFLK